MSDKDSKGRSVPSSRISRFSQLTGLATKVGGSVLKNSAVSLLSGKRPELKSLVLTPSNITRITNQLANMRGAAMKMGQILSIDDGEFISPELSAILARLRDNAEPMPKEQLQTVLDEAWGMGWKDELLYFSYAPIAAASIGQVHKAILMDGTTLAIKVQYPGIRKSIDSDVDNVMGLINLIGLIPKEANIQPLLEAAKHQLHDEANYDHEAKMLESYAKCIEYDPRFICPSIDKSRTSSSVLAMTFLKGVPLSALEQASQDVKNAMMSSLFDLFFKEIFEFQLIQSDPNLANYLVNLDTQQWLLLDFGATRPVPDALRDGYLFLIRAADSEDDDKMIQAAKNIGLLNDDVTETQLALVLNMLVIACEPLHSEKGYDFAKSDAATRLQDFGWNLSMKENFWQAPPADAVFVHRKLGGLYLLAKRLKVTVNMRQLLLPYLAP
jgi:predicted unusual protein kinase regulating ubiquinone biosynthesis (AarF/ABC1/UbiB family)